MVEVEGGKYEGCLDKIGDFLRAREPNLQHLVGGVLVAYTCEPTGRGTARRFPLVPCQTLIDKGQQVSGECENKAIIVVVVSKQFERERESIRMRNDDYSGKVDSVVGYEVTREAVIGPVRLWPVA